LAGHLVSIGLTASLDLLARRSVPLILAARGHLDGGRARLAGPGGMLREACANMGIPAHQSGTANPNLAGVAFAPPQALDQ